MTFRHSGDAGDIVFALAIIKASGEKSSLCLVDRQGITNPITPRFKNIAPLIAAQPYISECLLSEKKVDCDFVMFRYFHRSTQTLMQSHLMQYQLETDLLMEEDGSEPWLTCDASKKTKGRIVVARSPRYNNCSFPWAKVVRHYGERLLFVGLPEEHTHFVQAFGWVEYATTKTLLDVAELIQGAELFIGNQSSPMSIALGLGKPFLQEVCLDQPDVVYRRSNAQYVVDGACILPDIDDSGELVLEAPEKDIAHYNRNLIPPGMWQYPGLPANPNFALQIGLVMAMEKCNNHKADELLLRHNVKRVPDFFQERGDNPLEKFTEAYFKAFGVKPTQKALCA